MAALFAALAQLRVDGDVECPPLQSHNSGVVQPKENIALCSCVICVAEQSMLSSGNS